MTFLEGAFLAGLLGVAIPVVIHLLQRGKARKVRFPSLRFLREVEVRTARRSRIQEWIVLAVRAAALTALALALARPVLRGNSMARGRASRVVVIDNSLSMDARLDGVSALERSLLVARGLAERMGRADRAAVLPLHGSGGPRSATGSSMKDDAPVAPVLTESRADLQRAIEQVRPTYRDSPVLPAVQQALDLLSEESQPVREVYVLGDFQASAFEGDEAPLEIPEGVTVVLLRPRIDARPNVHPASGRVIPRAGGKRNDSTLRVRLRGNGGESVARLRFSTDGIPREERATRVPDAGESFALFGVPEMPSGLHRLEVRTDDDVLPADDTLEIPYTVRTETRILLVRDAARAAGTRDPAFYASRALVPRPRPGTRLVVEALTTEEITSRGLSGVDVVFLLEPGSIEPGTGATLARFVMSGGGLFITAGPDQPPDALDAMASGGAPGGASRSPTWCNPVQLGSIVRAADKPFRISVWEEQHPVWAPLLSTSPPLRPDAPVFVAYRRVAPEPGAEVLARFDSGDPALVLRRAGEGKVLFFAATLSEAWGNLPLRYLFAPWVHSVVTTLSPGTPDPEEVLTGTRLFVRRPEGSGLTEAVLHPPEGEPVRVEATLESREEDSTPPGNAKETPTQWLRADLGSLDRPGIYIVEERLGEQSSQRVVSVRPPEAESDLRPLGEDRLRELVPGAHVIVFSSPREALSRTLTVTVGSELKGILLCVLLGLLLLDPLLANRSAFRHASADVSGKSTQEASG